MNPTPAQLHLIDQLCSERGIATEEPLTIGEASALIEQLMRTPKTQGEERPAMEFDGQESLFG